MITAASIFFGVFFSILMTSLQEGTLMGIIHNMAKTYSGYLQIQHEKFWENRSINNTFEITDSLLAQVNTVEEITFSTPRLESFALAATGDITKGTMVVGVDPELEDELTGVSKWIESGNYLQSGDKGVLIGNELAKYLKVGLNDSIVLLGQGYHGASAVGLYHIQGILKFPSPEMNRQVVYMDLNNCQELYSAPSMSTSLVLMVKDYKFTPSAMSQLQVSLKSPYRVLDWIEMQAAMVEFVEGKRAGRYLITGILFMIIIFGILGTIIMMVAERQRELGMVIALGMRKFKLCIISFIEILLIGTLGVLAGLMVCFPIVSYWYKNPISLEGTTMGQVYEDMGFEPLISFANDPFIFYNPALTIYIFTIILAFYPIYSIAKLKPADALKP